MKHEAIGMDNRSMAATLFNIATLLKREGNKNPYRTEAYERCARALMGLRDDARQIVGEKGKVPFRRRQHIGTKLHAKIREMAEEGNLAQYQEALDDLPPHFRELMQVDGIGVVSAENLYNAGITNRDELAKAAYDGRLKRIYGFGEKRVAAIRELFCPQKRLFE